MVASSSPLYFTYRAVATPAPKRQLGDRTHAVEMACIPAQDGHSTARADSHATEPDSDNLPFVSVPDMGQFASRYATRGFAVLPVGSDKRPLTLNGVKDATCDQDAIEWWWRRWPKAGIGIACAPSDLIVVDYDPRGDPDGSGWAYLESLSGGNWRTWRVRTGSGGMHIYFRRPRDFTIRNSHNKLGPGIDVCVHGYVIAPPSRTRSGEYHWLSGPDGGEWGNRGMYPLRELPL